MTILNAISRITSSAAKYWFSPAANSNDGVLDYLTGSASNSNFSDQSLSYIQFDDQAQLVAGPVALGRHPIPTSTTSSGVSFDDQYNTLELSDGEQGVVFTDPTTANFAANGLTSFKFEALDDAGDIIQGPTTLQLGGKDAVKDLYRINEGSLADFGNSFVAAYSTYDPSTGKAKIAYTKFDEAGDALSSGTLRTFDDDSHHGLDFGSFYTAENPNTVDPDYMLIDRPSGSGSAVQVELLDVDMQEVASRTIAVTGPQGQKPTSIDTYNYLRPGTGTDDDFGVVSETYGYKDSSGDSHEGVELEKVDPVTLQTLARAFIAVPSGNQTGVGLQHLSDGNILALYNDGGQSYVKEFDQNLHQVGHAFALPKDDDGWDNFVALGNDQFQIDWRQNTGTGTTVKHSAVFQAS